MKHLLNSISIILLSFVCVGAYAQQGAETEVTEKPKQYENRKLASEKTGEKKFTLKRRIVQNTTTHYNYYFNANNRLNEVVERAKLSFKDDYSRLLPFYNYTLETTSQDKSELDSVIYKSTAGILLHDLRSDWVDNMYLLMAKAYFFRNDLDSATLTLQYLNFAFAPKEDGGYDIPIGSNSSNETGIFSIATNEKRSVLKKMTSRPPSRNESFIWQIRSYIEHDELHEAAGLIEILKSDPQFPSRLQTDLQEVIAHWYYKQEIYDSAAFHLSKALSEATNKQEKARWEYLIGQMYQRTNKNDLAVEYYNRSISHTIDPVMDVYARLNSLRINRGGDKRDYQQENIDALVKMAKRDKYTNYRDIIYYAAATIELDRKNYDAAEDLLLKSVKFTNENPQQRSETFLLLADMNYDRKKYTPASNFYDSTDIQSLKEEVARQRVELRKPPLKIVAANELTVFSEDSLQALAKMPVDKRDAIIKKTLKQLRKSQGIKEEEPQSSNPAILQNQPADLFGDNSKNNDFYFYNASLKARGFSEFKAKWGQRNNVDNWRRLSEINKQSLAPSSDVDVVDVPAAEEAGGSDLSFEGLLGKLPITEEQLTASNKNIEEALFTLGETFLSKLEDYPSAIYAFEELLRRFPNSAHREEALFNLVYASKKVGDPDKSDVYKKQLLSADTSKWAQIIKNPELGKKEDISKAPATKKYEQIYTMFIEGNFEQAKAEKKAADSIYDKSYWTPQLLFIESIYYVKEKDDSTAIKVLTDLTQQFGTSPMAEKAKTMIDVLKRRNEIEDYLTKLEVTRSADRPGVPVREKQQVVVTPKPVVPQPKPAVKDSVQSTVQKPVVQPQQTPKDSIISPVQTARDTVQSPIETAKDSVQSPTPTLEDSLQSPTQAFLDSSQLPDTETDPLADPGIVPGDTVPASSPVIIVKGFAFAPADPHFVVVVLDKVDQVYASEAKNAFNRYNREKFYSGKPIEMSSLQLDDRFHFVLQGPFSDANAAVDYIDKVKPVAPSRILPWLTTDKYSFLVISAANLDVLKTNKDIDAYKQLIQQAFPGRF